MPRLTMTGAANLVFDGAVRLQAHRWLRRRLGDDIVILAYHGFTATSARSGVRNFHGKHVAVDALRHQLQYLRRYHSVLSLTDLVRALTGQIELPPRPVVITIDDGYRSTYTVAFPALLELGLPASVFVATDFVGRQRPLWPDRIEHALTTTRVGGLEVRLKDRTLHLDTESEGARIAACRTLFDVIGRMSTIEAATLVQSIEADTGRALAVGDDEMFAPLRWSELTEMRRSGLVEIGSHSVTHPFLTRCDRDMQRAEIAVSKTEIEAMSGGPCDVFSYPNGQPGDFDEATATLLRATGYRAALTTVPGTNTIATDPYALRRFTITDTEPFATFVMKIYGVVNAASRVKTAIRAAIPGRSHA